MTRAKLFAGATACLIACGTSLWANDVSDYVEALNSGDIRTAERLERSAISALDGFAETDPEEFLEQMASLREQLEAVTAGSDEEASLARLFCRIEPFALANDEATQGLRRQLNARFEANWERYRADRENQDAVVYYEIARFLDCGVHNAADSYFGVIGNATLEVAPYASCATRQYPDSGDLARMAGQLNGIATEAAVGGISFYWPRVLIEATRAEIATVLARLRADEIDFEAARHDIGRLGDRLLDAAADPRLINARNGWRLANDIAYHGALYRLVGPASPEEHQKARDWLIRIRDSRPVREEGPLSTAAEPWILERIAADDPGYFDPILVDRLFPGLLADPTSDCERNRRQSLEPEDLAGGTLACFGLEDAPDTGGVTVAGLAALRDLDECLTSIESAVWWVQVGAFRERETANDAREQFLKEVDLLAEADQDGPAIEIPELLVIEPDATTEFHRVRTEDTLTRRDAGALADAAERIGWSALIGRQPIW